MPPNPPYSVPNLPNYFISSLAQTLNDGGNDTSIQLGTIFTLDGQEVLTSDFATFGRGILTIDPLNLNAVEFASFTGITPGTPPAGTVTGVLRGLSDKANTQIPANQTFHVTGTPVLIAFGTHNIIDLVAMINNTYTSLFNLIESVVILGALPARTTLPGIVMMAEDSDIQTQNDTRTYGTQTYDLSVLPHQIANIGIRSFLASQTITALEPVYATTYTNGGGILPDNAAVSTASNYSFTVGNNPNRILIVAVATSGNTGSISISGVTYGGVAMTGIGDSILSNNGYGHSIIVALFKMIAPPIGSNGIIITATGTLPLGTVTSSANSFYNVDQVTGIDVVTTLTGNSSSASTTTLEDDCVIFGAAGVFGVFAGPGHPGTGSIAFNAVPGSVEQTPIAFVSGYSGVYAVPTAVTGVYNFDSGSASSDGGIIPIQCSIKPAGTTVPGIAVADSADTAHSTTFIGFATQGGIENDLLPVVTTGYVDGFTGLTPGHVYYLNDTAGTIGTSPGTVTKIIGISVSATTLLLVVNG